MTDAKHGSSVAQLRAFCCVWTHVEVAQHDAELHPPRLPLLLLHQLPLAPLFLLVVAVRHHILRGARRLTCKSADIVSRVIQGVSKSNAVVLAGYYRKG